MRKVVCMMVALVVSAVSGGAMLEIPNHSFELPETGSFNWGLDDWGKAGGVGVFNNNAGFGNFITNADGEQMVFMNANFSTIGEHLPNFWVSLADVFAAGMDYTLSIGVAARSDATPGDAANTKMEMRFWSPVVEGLKIAAQEIVYSDLSNTALTYYTLTLKAEDIPAEALGTNIGLWFVSTVGNTGGDWTLDNVTLSAIPEPATLFMLGLGGLAFLKRRE